MSADLRVLTIVGTRPEVIRLSRVIAELDRRVTHRLVHTGQNDDPSLNQVFFEELGIREPDHRLGVDTSSVGRMLGDAFVRIESVLELERPDAVLVLGDTNSALTALLAKRMGITVFHMEAGNRCFDANVPEETNRRIIDHFADVNLVYTEHARRNLLAEGLHPQRVYLTGSPLREVLDHHRSAIAHSSALSRLGLEPGSFFLVSMHREENVDDAARLDGLLDAIIELSARHDLDTIVSTHPRTRQRLDEIGRSAAATRVRFLPPFGFLDYNALQLHARCVISDSGSVSEEAAILGFPAVTIRNAIERPEAMDTGSIVLAGTTADGLLDAVDTVLAAWRDGHRPSAPPEYEIADCAQRVLRLVVALARVQPIWDRLDRPKRDRIR